MGSHNNLAKNVEFLQLKLTSLVMIKKLGKHFIHKLKS